MFNAITDTNITVNSNIILRSANENFASALFDITEKNRTYLRRWLPWLDTVTSAEDSQLFISHQRQLAKQGRGVQFMIFYNQILVGCVGYHNRDTVFRHAEIGYWLDERYTGKGIMTHAVNAVLDYGFTTLNLRKIGIRCATGNLKSRKIPERLGFTLEHMRQRCEWLYDHHVDHAVYALYIDDHLQRQRSPYP